MSSLAATATPDDFGDKTNEELHAELARCLSLSADNLMRCALLVKELESRGEDLSGLRIGLLHHLRKIACGQLLPEVVVKFSANPMLMKKISNLPIADQKRLADGQHVKLLTYRPDGTLDHRLADPLTMTPKQVRQAFQHDHICDDAEQRAILDDENAKLKRKIPAKIGEMTIDRERGGVVIGRKFVPLADLVSAVSTLRR